MKNNPKSHKKDTKGKNKKKISLIIIAIVVMATTRPSRRSLSRPLRPIWCPPRQPSPAASFAAAAPSSSSRSPSSSPRPPPSLSSLPRSSRPTQQPLSASLLLLQILRMLKNSSSLLSLFPVDPLIYWIREGKLVRGSRNLMRRWWNRAGIGQRRRLWRRRSVVFYFNFFNIAFRYN